MSSTNSFEQVTAPPPAAKPPSRTRKVLLITAAAVALLCVLCCLISVLISFLSGSNPIKDFNRGWEEEGQRETRVAPATPAPATCPTPVLERRKCPWSPEGYSIEPCGPGFCWDGGPQGLPACKQEQTVPNSHRTNTNDLVCDDGYTAESDRCTKVIIRCVKK